MKKRNLLLALPLGAGLILGGCAEGAQEDTEEPNTEEVEVEHNKLESEPGSIETNEEEGNAGMDEEEPDLDEEPSEEEGNAGMDEEEPDLDEEPSEEANEN